VFGSVDVGGFAYKLNRLEKATQVGTRFAVVTDPVAKGLISENYLGRNLDPANAGTPILQQGDIIPAAALGVIKCTSAASCTCQASPCLSGTNPDGLTADTAAFGKLVARMANIDPTVTSGKVTIEYAGSGLGYAGDPDGMQVVPLVTVRLTGMQYKPILGLIFNASINLPDFSFTLPMEDASGSKAN
jgi:hypothetical protein